MIYWTIKTIVISIIFIFLIHHLIEFFKNTLNVPTQKYEHILNMLSKNKNTNDNSNNIENLNNSINLSTNINNLPVAGDDMKSELKKFLKQQMTNNIYNS